MNITCVISARGGSKGLSGKNIRPLLGKPLLAWSIEQAHACPEISRIVVSTDCQAIANIALDYGAEVPFIRPPELSHDSAGKWGVWQHALQTCDAIYPQPIDIYVDLDCTSPLREPSDITNAINQFTNANVDVIFSVCQARKNPYFNLLELRNNRLRISKSLSQPVLCRQQAPIVYEHVASIYILSPHFLRTGTGLLSGIAQGYDIGQEKSLDVDSEYDFDLVEYLMKKREVAYD